MTREGFEVVLNMEEDRARKLASAKKKVSCLFLILSTKLTLLPQLKTFRATRNSRSSASSTSSVPRSPRPLMDDMASNMPRTPPRSPTKWSTEGSSKRMKKTQSKGSMGGHRRQPSSISHPSWSGPTGAGLARGSVMGLFEEDRSPIRAAFPAPTDIAHPTIATLTPVTPTMQQKPFHTDDLAPRPPLQNEETVKDRLNTFSFGAKPPQKSERDIRKSLSPSPSVRTHLASPTSFPSPGNSPIKRLSTPGTRGPSLLLTRPTPLHFPSSDPHKPGPPATPPTPARGRRHSHTRSNSISLPNLKLASRPPSLGIPLSPSFPQSPISPAAASRLGVDPPQHRLKFEPSGRGAEAEKEKEEYRKKALEKLTGSSPVINEDSRETPPLVVAEISLPDLDDEDDDSTASSAVRPISGYQSTFNFGRPTSSTSTPGLSWSSGNEDSSPGWERSSDLSPEREKEDGLGFGLPSVSSSGSNKTVSQTKISTSLVLDTPPSIIPALSSRPSMTRNLSVLAEVDESEEGGEEVFNDIADQILNDNRTFTSVVAGVPPIVSPESQWDSPDPSPVNLEIISAKHEPSPSASSSATGVVRPVPADEGDAETNPNGPTPSRLRQLHLVSTHSSKSSPAGFTLQGVQETPGSPTKGYGGIGRGRPKPMALVTSGSTDTNETPSKGVRERPSLTKSAGRSGGSSISYKKDVEPSPIKAAFSSSAPNTLADARSAWSYLESSGSEQPGGDGSNSLFSPQMKRTALSPRQKGSPPKTTSPRFGGYGGMGRSNRPCPRPKSLVGLGLEGKGAGRILGEVEEADEEADAATRKYSRKASRERAFSAASTRSDQKQMLTTGNDLEETTDENKHTLFSWREPRVGFDLERDVSKEDVELWKDRCQGMEAALDREKREVAVLRDRVRKRESCSKDGIQSAVLIVETVGDRLSSVSSHQSARVDSESTLVSEMRNQLFSLTSQLDKERQERQASDRRVAELQAELEALRVGPTGRSTDPTQGSASGSDTSRTLLDPSSDGLDLPFIISSAAPLEVADSNGIQLPPEEVESNEETLAEIEINSNPADPNLGRMRAWGFPSREGSPRSTPSTSKSPKKGKTRDSFFGLSAVLRNSVETETDSKGIDLPPLDPASLSGTGRPNPSQFARRGGTFPKTVTNPLVLSSPETDSSPALPRSSSSITSSASSALSFFSGYLPFSPNSPKRQPRSVSRSKSLARVSTQGKAEVPPMPPLPPIPGTRHRLDCQHVQSGLDLTRSCRCCVGAVLEL